tara:strand:+ start:570 stop:2474 length:1905 start_codon:yes stop_codon:yes gene_type:complete
MSQSNILSNETLKELSKKYLQFKLNLSVDKFIKFIKEISEKNGIKDISNIETQALAVIQYKLGKLTKKLLEENEGRPKEDNLKEKLKHFESDEFTKNLEKPLPFNIRPEQEESTEYTGYIRDIFKYFGEDIRKNYLEDQGAQKQCEKVLKSVPRKDLEKEEILLFKGKCYLCGCNINEKIIKRRRSVDEEGELEPAAQRQKQEGGESRILQESEHDTPECEHILPLFSAITHLYIYKQGMENIQKENKEVTDEVLKCEYAWAHRCCNQVKTNKDFIKYNVSGEYVINNENIVKFVEDVSKNIDNNNYDCKKINEYYCNNEMKNNLKIEYIGDPSNKNIDWDKSLKKSDIKKRIDQILTIINKNFNEIKKLGNSNEVTHQLYILFLKFKLLNSFAKDKIIDIILKGNEESEETLTTEINQKERKKNEKNKQIKEKDEEIEEKKNEKAKIKAFKNNKQRNKSARVTKNLNDDLKNLNKDLKNLNKEKKKLEEELAELQDIKKEVISHGMQTRSITRSIANNSRVASGIFPKLFYRNRSSTQKTKNNKIKQTKNNRMKQTGKLSEKNIINSLKKILGDYYYLYLIFGIIVNEKYDPSEEDIKDIINTNFIYSKKIKSLTRRKSTAKTSTRKRIHNTV